MFEIDPIETPVPPRPRTLIVLAIILLATLSFSYLIAYAVTSALAAQGLLAPFPRPHDPRPRWMVCIFVATVAVLLIVAILFRRSSRRQMMTIDALSEAEDTPEE